MFFTAINPAIATGGLFGESKRDINDLIHPDLMPKTVYTIGKPDFEAVLQSMESAGLSFPVICKPDVGERGFNVALIRSSAELKQYLEAAQTDLIIQEYVDYPLEFSILCYDFPLSSDCGITSVCQKEFLCVKGDGQSTLRSLIGQHPRALLQRHKLYKRPDIDAVPPYGTTLYLEPIGNHCRGTKFLNANHLIDEQLTEVLVGILRQMPEVQFGRFDLRTRSVEDLRNGRDFKILEFNGTGSEPAHIYDPGYGIRRAYRDLWHQWDLMRRIASEQHKRGVRSTGLLSTIRALRAHLGYKRTARLALDS